MCRRLDLWFVAMLCVLATLDYCLDVRASGTANILLSSGGASALSTTLTAGNNVVSGNGEIGYASGSFGSLSNSSLLGGRTVIDVYDLVVDGTVTQEWVKISGFSASPGANWLGNVTFNGQTFRGSTAVYSYTSGTASWQWGTVGGWGFTNTDAYPGTLSYQ